MTRRLFAASLLATLLAGCQLDETTDGPVAACMDVGSACTENRECCSYGCVQGFCMANLEDGGQCRTSDDCAAGACRSGRCDQDAVCRDESDVCGWDSQCCTKTCDMAGKCVQNSAPVVVVTSNANAEGKIATGTPIVFAAGGSSDPDGDLLSYGWQVVQLPSLAPVACANGTSGSTCTISSPQLGSYRAVVTVTDGKIIPAPQKTIDVEVVNLPPIVQTMTVSDDAPSRNVPFTVSATVVDPDGDPLTCSWTSTAPGGTPQPIVGATSCTTASFTAPTEGAWTFTILPDDGIANASVTRTVTATVINDAPVVSATSAVYGNMGAIEAATDPITLESTASDTNGDEPLAYAWTQTSGGGVVLSDPTSPTPTFTPPGEGTYTFTVTATDPAQFGRVGATSAPATVTAHVGRPVIALPGVVRDAEFARPAGGDVIVAAGVDPADATKGKLWIIEAATGATLHEASLPTVPNSVSTNADASLVAVGASTAFWWVTFGTTTTVTEGTEPFELADVVLAGDKRVFLFPKSAAFTSYIYAFDITSITAPASTSQGGQKGRLAPGGAWLYALDASWNEILRYTATTSGQAGSALGYGGWSSSASYACTPTDLWLTPDGAELFTTCGDVYTTATMTKRTDESLGGYVVHADATTGGIVVSRGGELDRFDLYYTLIGTDLLPIWGWDGGNHPTSAEFAFLGSDGTRHAVVTAGGRSGLVSFAP